MTRRSDLLTRRDFLHDTALGVTSVCLLGCEAHAQEVPSRAPRALDDPAVVHGVVSIADGVDAYLARPKAKGKYPVVVVVTGSSIRDEYIPNTTAMLAQHGFVGLAPNIFSLQLPSMTAEEMRRVFAEKITDERIFGDIRAGRQWANRQSYVKRGRIGITGFCFGGRCALLFAAQSSDVGAVVPFYGNLKTPPFANRAIDPVDVVGRIHAPVQGHYVRNDSDIPLVQLQTFEAALRSQGTPVEMYVYDVEHGFFAYNRRTYDAAAAALAWKRTIAFLNRHL
jgi:carboxymethylenebutenolidase